MKKRLAFAAAFTFAIVYLAGCSSGDENVVRAAFVPAAYYLPFLVVENDGLLEKRGYGLQLQRYNDNAEMISAFLNDNLDVTAQGANTMFPVEMENPGRYKFVYGQYVRSYFYVVPDSLAYNNLADLAGDTIVTWRSPTAEVFIKLTMRRQGIADSVYHISRVGATEWAPALENGVATTVFGFDVPVAGLLAQPEFRVLQPDAVENLFLEEPEFNGGAFIRTKLIVEDPAKARAIREALFEALETIRSEPDRVRSILANRLGAAPEVVAEAALDRFAWPNQQMIDHAQRMWQELGEQGFLQGETDIQNLFWLSGN